MKEAQSLVADTVADAASTNNVTGYRRLALTLPPADDATMYAPTEAFRYLEARGVPCSPASIKRWVDVGLLVGTRTAAGRRLVQRHELDRFAVLRREAAAHKERP